MNTQHATHKAFTLLELVFVIVVIGILAAAIIPRLDNNHNAESAVKLISDIRNTQHLALTSDKYSNSKKDWYKDRWHIVFNGVKYSIMSGTTYAKDPMTKEDMKDIDLKIDSIAFGGGCPAGTNQINFDYMGRPIIGTLSDETTAYNKLKILRDPCIITLKNSGETDSILKLYPETGYISRD